MPQDEYVEQRTDRRRNGNFGIIVAIASLALAFVVQFGGTIWVAATWGATMSADLRHVTEVVTRIDSERYTKSDAARDIQRLDQRDALITEQQSELRARIMRLEDRIK